MKKSILTLLGLCLILVAFQSTTVNAQADEDILMMVSIDKVEMSKIAEYEKAVKNFNAKHQEAKVKSVGWWGNSQENATYVYAVPIDDMASLDNAYWAESAKKLGDATLKNLFKDMNQYVESTQLLIYNMEAELSYMNPNTPYNGSDYRETTYYQFKAGSAEEVEELAKGYKKLYTDNALSGSFQVYRNLFGNQDEWVVLDFAKSAKEMAENNAANNKKLGTKGQELQKKMLSLLVSTNVVTGRFRPDLTYFPEPEDEPTAGSSTDK